jgi:hypothetical protein
MNKVAGTATFGAAKIRQHLLYDYAFLTAALSTKLANDVFVPGGPQ